jgi:hypothetical protein
MKRSSKLTITLALPFAIALVVAGGHATELRASALAPSPGRVQAQNQQNEPAVNTFTGKIMSQNGVRFILRDDSNDLWYHLDDQKQAAKYLGKIVQVTGTLHGRTDMIRVRNITETKS